MKRKFFSLPTKYSYLYFFIPFILSILVSTHYDNDIWFLLNQGRYIIENGFPHIDPFTIHENLTFVVQQWLSASLFYSIYHFFGAIGLSLLMIGINLLILYFLYKLCLLISNNRAHLAIFFTILVDILLLMNFIQIRPQIFTYLILLILMYVLEKYQRERKRLYLLFLPLLSLLEINLHASMWFMLFLFLLPYVIEIVIHDYQRKGLKDSYPLLISIGIMLLVGLINPYGIDAITYIFTSYGNSSINEFVQEMQVPQLTTSIGLIIYITIFSVYFIYLISKKRTIKIKYLCLTIGTTYLALTSHKSFAFFLLGGVLPLVCGVKEYFSVTETPKIKKTPYQQGAIVFLLLVSSVVFISLPHQLTNPLEPHIDYLLSDYEEESIILYTGFTEGGYAEYRGLKTYIDPRAEIFLKANNHQKDIFQEYYDLQKGKLLPEKFISTYSFTHLIVNWQDALYPYLQQEKEKFNLLFSSGEYYLFENISVKNSK